MNVTTMVIAVHVTCARTTNAFQHVNSVALVPLAIQLPIIVPSASVQKVILAAPIQNAVPNVMVILIVLEVDQLVSMVYARIHAMVPAVLAPIVICVA